MGRTPVGVAASRCDRATGLIDRKVRADRHMDAGQARVLRVREAHTPTRLHFSIRRFAAISDAPRLQYCLGDATRGRSPTSARPRSALRAETHPVSRRRLSIAATRFSVPWVAPS